MACYLILADSLPAGEQALTYAVALAPALAATLVLLSVRPATPRGARPGPYITATAREALCQRYQTSLSPGTLRDGGELPAATLADSLAQCVQRYEATLIIVGRTETIVRRPLRLSTHGLWATILWVSPCPVLIVPPDLASVSIPRRALVVADGLSVRWGGAGLAANTWLHACALAVTTLYVITPARTLWWATISPAVKAHAYDALLQGLPEVDSRQCQHADFRTGVALGAHGGQADVLIIVARHQQPSTALFTRHDFSVLLLTTLLPVLVVRDSLMNAQ